MGSSGYSTLYLLRVLVVTVVTSVTIVPESLRSDPEGLRSWHEWKIARSDSHYRKEGIQNQAFRDTTVTVRVSVRFRPSPGSTSRFSGEARIIRGGPDLCWSCSVVVPR